MVLHRHGGVLYQGLVGVTTEHLLHVKVRVARFPNHRLPAFPGQH